MIFSWLTVTMTWPSRVSARSLMRSNFNRRSMLPSTSYMYRILRTCNLSVSPCGRGKRTTDEWLCHSSRRVGTRSVSHLSTVPTTNRRLSGCQAQEDTWFCWCLYVCAQCPVSVFHNRTWPKHSPARNLSPLRLNFSTSATPAAHVVLHRQHFAQPPMINILDAGATGVQICAEHWSYLRGAGVTKGNSAGV